MTIKKKAKEASKKNDKIIINNVELTKEEAEKSLFASLLIFIMLIEKPSPLFLNR